MTLRTTDGEIAWDAPLPTPAGRHAGPLPSNTVRLHRKLRAAGVDVERHVFEAVPHGDFGGAPDDLEVRIGASCPPTQSNRQGAALTRLSFAACGSFWGQKYSAE